MLNQYLFNRQKNIFFFLSEISNNSLNNTLFEDIPSIYSNIDILNNSYFLSDFNLMVIPGTNEKENDNKKELFKTELLKKNEEEKLIKKAKKQPIQLYLKIISKEKFKYTS